MMEIKVIRAVVTRDSLRELALASRVIISRKRVILYFEQRTFCGNDWDTFIT